MSIKNEKDDENENFSFWQSYSDLMSALLLMFVLVMAAILMQSMNLYQEKMAEEEAAQIEMENKVREQQMLNDKLMQQQDQLTEQKEQLILQQDLLDEQQGQIENLIGLKESIIVSLADEFSKTDLVVAVDPSTGSITFDSSILFQSDSYELSDKGKKFLDGFIPVYFDALLNSEYSSYISEIIIEGHTDTDGSYMYNLELSQKRALTVCQYCLDSIEKSSDFDIAQIRKIMTANGRSWSNPIYETDGITINKNASRRVEFKFRLKDDEMISTMKDILEDK